MHFDTRIIVKMVLLVTVSIAAAVAPAYAESVVETGLTEVIEVTDTPKVESVTRIEEVSILGDPDRVQDIAGSAYLLDEAFLSRFEQGDILRVLQAVPGVYLQDEDGAGLRPNIGIRGSGLDRSSRIALLEDGVLIAPAPYASPSAYYFPTQRRMSSIEVLKGPSSIRQGSRTTGGALNMVSTPIPGQQQAEAEIFAGQDGFSEGHLWYGDSQQNIGWLLESVQQRSDGFKQLDTGGSTGFDIRDYMAKLRVNSSPGSKTSQAVEIKLGYTTQISDETYLGLTQEDFDLNPYRRYAASQLDQIGTTHRQQQISYSLKPGNTAWSLDLTAYNNEFARNWFKLDSVDGIGISNLLDNPQSFSDQMAWVRGQLDSADDAFSLRNNNRSYYSRGLQAVVGLSTSHGLTDHNWQIGIRLHKDEEDRFQHDDLYAMRNSNLALTSAGVPGSQSNRVSDSKVSAVFIEDQISIGAWELTPGLRMERISLTRTDYATSDSARSDIPTNVRSNTVDIVIPGIGVSYAVASDWRLIAGAHRGFNPPAPGSLADFEDSRNFEFGARYTGPELRAEAIGFYNDYRNLVGTCTASTGGSCLIGDQFDGGQATAAGMEALLSYRFSELGNTKLSLPVRFAYTWTAKAEFDTSFVSGFSPWGAVEAGDELPYIPKHQFQIAADLAGLQWQAGLNINYVDQTRTVAGQGAIEGNQRTDAHWLLDFAGNYRLTDGFELFGRIDNLLDNDYAVARRPAGLRPGKPRTAIVGFRVKL